MKKLLFASMLSLSLGASVIMSGSALAAAYWASYYNLTVTPGANISARSTTVREDMRLVSGKQEIQMETKQKASGYNDFLYNSSPTAPFILKGKQTGKTYSLVKFTGTDDSQKSFKPTTKVYGHEKLRLYSDDKYTGITCWVNYNFKSTYRFELKYFNVASGVCK